MVFNNQSYGMHVAVTTLAATGAALAIIASVFMGMYVHEVKTTLKEEEQLLQHKWTGQTAYVTNIIAVILFAFVTVYIGFDLLYKKGSPTTQSL